MIVYVTTPKKIIRSDYQLPEHEKGLLTKHDALYRTDSYQINVDSTPDFVENKDMRQVKGA